MKHCLLLGSVCLLLIACATSGPSIAPETEAQLQTARQQLQQGDPDAALAITDQLLREHPNWVAANRVAAASNLELAKVDRRGLDPRLVLGDAAEHFERVLAVDEDDAGSWIGLADAHYQLGQYEVAEEDALQGLRLLQTDPNGNVVLMTNGMLITARCHIQQLVALRQEEAKTGEPDENGFVRPGVEARQHAAMALSMLENVQRTMPNDGYGLAANVYQWLGQHDEALATLERGIRADPNASELHDRYQDIYVEMGQTRALASAYRRFVRENPGQTILVWHQGRALVRLADDLRSKSSYASALQAYGQARDCFASYVEAVPLHRNSANWWLAFCDLSMARMASQSGDVATSKKHLYQAAELSPTIVLYEGMTPTFTDSFGSHFAAVVFDIGRILIQGGEDSLPNTLAFYEEIIEQWPGKWGFVYNNAALPARDLGVQIMRRAGNQNDEQTRAAEAEAMALWEKSYRYYEEAVRLTPDDPRIINDCGLMLIYHLNRDFDRARECFDLAIEIGQPQLDALPEDASRQERNDLEEAVGDAWQNIAVLMEQHLDRPYEEYEPFCRKAIEYYPYRQRQAARMLDRGQNGQIDGSQASPSRGPAASTPSASFGSPDPEKFKEAKAKAEEQAAAGDLDGALQVLDGYAAELKNYAPFHHLRGDLGLRYAITARDNGRKDVEFLFQDAVAELTKAVELDSTQAEWRLQLAHAQYEAGMMDKAALTASELLSYLQAQGVTSGELFNAVHKARANAASRYYIGNQEAADRAEKLEEARLSFRFLEQQKLLDDDLRNTWSTMEGWAGAPAEAVAVYARGLAADPDNQALMDKLVATAINLGATEAAAEALADRTDATALWFRGKAQYFTGAAQRSNGENEAALKSLDEALGSFEKSKQLNPDYGPSCNQWIAICLGKKGNAAFTLERLDDAQNWLLASLELEPQRINDDLGLAETTKLGILRVADKFYQAGNLERTEAIYRRASDTASSDLDLLNNAGLFARDWGNRLERNGKAEQAQEMYEQSYKAYCRAQELDPTNVRLANDRTLIAIYHLERDWDISKRLLEAAAKMGEEQLADFPQDQPQERQFLEEATGDCYENLALWHIKHSKDAAAAKAAAQESLKYYPGQVRPGARRHLRTAERMQEDN